MHRRGEHPGAPEMPAGGPIPRSGHSSPGAWRPSLSAATSSHFVVALASVDVAGVRLTGSHLGLVAGPHQADRSKGEHSCHQSPGVGRLVRFWTTRHVRLVEDQVEDSKGQPLALPAACGSGPGCSLRGYRGVVAAIFRSSNERLQQTKRRIHAGGRPSNPWHRRVALRS